MASNHLLILLELFPDLKGSNQEKWDWEGVSSNPNINLDIILAHPEWPWDWYYASTNLNIAVKDIITHPKLPWEWRGLLKNPSIAIDDDILNFLFNDPYRGSDPCKSYLFKKENELKWHAISGHPTITTNTVLKYLDAQTRSRINLSKPEYRACPISMGQSFSNPPLKVVLPGWPYLYSFWLEICAHSQIPLEDILRFLPFLKDNFEDFSPEGIKTEQYWKELSDNSSITIDDIEKYINRPWDWNGISCNPNITVDFVFKHSDKPWAWKCLSSNSNIKLDDILKYIDCPSLKWDMNLIWRNASIGMGDILDSDGKISSKAKRLEINWDSLTMNPNISLNDILSHPELPWDQGSISLNRNITLDVILNHPFSMAPGRDILMWNWEDITRNPGITIENIMDHPILPSSLGGETELNCNRYKRSLGFVPRWAWEEVSDNPNLAYKNIIDLSTKSLSKIKDIFPGYYTGRDANLPFPWDFEKLSYNKFDRYNAAVRIQRCWRKKVHFFRWKRRIEETNLAILYNPKAGSLKFLEK